MLEVRRLKFEVENSLAEAISEIMFPQAEVRFALQKESMKREEEYMILAALKISLIAS